MEIYDINDREFKIAVLKTLGGKIIQQAIQQVQKTTNKTSISPRDWNFKKEPKRNPKDEEFNKRDKE